MHKRLVLLRVVFGKPWCPPDMREYEIAGHRGPVGKLEEIKDWIKDKKLPVEELQIIDEISDHHEVIKL